MSFQPPWQGRSFRREFVRVVGAHPEPDMIVECSGGAARLGSKKFTNHAEFANLLSRTLFCPVLPGENQGSQHLVERYVSGCIPIFVGPPYHALPFEKEVCLPLPFDTLDKNMMSIFVLLELPGAVKARNPPEMASELRFLA